MRPARFAAAVLALALAAPALLAPAASAATIPDAWVRNDDIPFASVPVLLPTLFSNNTGGVMALGFEPVNGTTRLVSSFFTLATGWSPLTVANASNSAEVFAPHGALGDDGSAVAAWELDPIANTTVGAAVYRPGVGWSASTTLSTTLNAAGADAAMGSDGRAIVTWTENVSGTYRARFAEQPVGQGWSAAVNLDSSEAGYAPEIDAGPGGTFVAAWPAPFGTDSALRSARYAPGTGWSAAGNVTALQGGRGVFAPDVEVAPDGSAFVTWIDFELPFVNLTARRQAAGGAWDATHPLLTSGLALTPARVVVDKAGNATIAWIDGGGSVVAHRYEAGSGWGAPMDLGSAGTAVTTPMLATGDDGGAMAVWHRNEPSDSYAAYARFSPGMGWGTESRLSPDVAYAEGSVVSLGGTNYLYAPVFGDGWNALFDITPPPLAVLTPASGAAFGYPVVDVTGMSEPRATVTVNGVAATVDAQGAWTARIALGEGLNDVRTVATDTAGHSVYENRTVRFDDPVPGLEADIATLQANVTAAQANVSAAMAAVAAAQAALSAAQANATATEAEMAALQADVAAAQAALAAAQANATATDADIAAMQAALTASAAEQQRLRLELNALNQSVANIERPAAPASDSLALMVALAGVALGALGLVMGLMRGRGGDQRASGGVPQSAEPAKGEHDKGPPPPPRG